MYSINTIKKRITNIKIIWSSIVARLTIQTVFVRLGLGPIRYINCGYYVELSVLCHKQEEETRDI